MKNALRKLWDMYEQSSKENDAKEKLIVKLGEEKKLIEEKHHNHIKETSIFFNNSQECDEGELSEDYAGW